MGRLEELESYEGEIESKESEVEETESALEEVNSRLGTIESALGELSEDQEVAETVETNKEQAESEKDTPYSTLETSIHSYSPPQISRNFIKSELERTTLAVLSHGWKLTRSEDCRSRSRKSFTLCPLGKCSLVSSSVRGS